MTTYLQQSGKMSSCLQNQSQSSAWDQLARISVKEARMQQMICAELIVPTTSLSPKLAGEMYPSICATATTTTTKKWLPNHLWRLKKFNKSDRPIHGNYRRADEFLEKFKLLLFLFKPLSIQVFQQGCVDVCDFLLWGKGFIYFFVVIVVFGRLSHLVIHSVQLHKWKCKYWQRTKM